MRIIYWKRYGIIVPLLVCTGILSTIVIIVRISLKSSKTDDQANENTKVHSHENDEVKRSEMALSDNDFAELVRRPHLGDFEDDDDFDDDLVPDPEDSFVDVESIVMDPNDISDMEQLRSMPGEQGPQANADTEEKTYTTEASSDLVEDDGGHGYTTLPTISRKKHKKQRRKTEQPVSTKSPITIVTDEQAQTIDISTAEGLVGAQDYHAAAASIDFQDGPLTPDEEYSLHLDDEEIMHAREGMHAHETTKPTYSTNEHLQEAPSDAYSVGSREAPSAGYTVSDNLQNVQAPVSQTIDQSVPEYTMDEDDEYTMDEDDEYTMDEDEYDMDEDDKVEKEPYVAPEKPMNVLFIIMDDLRPQLGAYEGRDYGAMNDLHKMYTPHIDRLASRSLVLKRAYAQYSMCGPSRASLMTSRRPDVTKVYQNYVYWRYWSVGNFSTIPQYFKDHGYVTLGAGKIYHVDLLPKDYDPASWSLPYFRPRPSEYDRNTSINWAAVPANATEPLLDQNTADYAVQKMEQLAHGANNGNPFFFAVGFNQPHFRHVCPAEFFEHYSLEYKKCMFKESWQTPPYMPRSNLAQLVEGVNNTDLTHIPSVPMREIRRAYFACVSYVDSLVGKLMAGLKENNLVNSTMVVLVSDHGYHLGDNDMFGTYSNHEMALHVPLIIRIPGKTNKGIESRSLVELIDVFPTLVEAVGLPQIPPCPARSSEIQVCTDGVSLLPLISRPKLYVKEAVFAQLQRGRSLTEYTIRTNKYRLIDLALHRRTMLYPGVYQHTLDFDLDLRGRLHGRRLYDLTKDPMEAVNCADDPAYAETIARLRAKLRRTFVNVYDYSKFLYQSFPE